MTVKDLMPIKVSNGLFQTFKIRVGNITFLFFSVILFLANYFNRKDDY